MDYSHLEHHFEQTSSVIILVLLAYDIGITAKKKVNIIALVQKSLW